MTLGPACAALLWMAAVLFHGLYGQHKSRVATSSKVASVGNKQVLDCALNISANKATSYLLQWRKDGIKEPILVKYDGYSAQVNNQHYQDRLTLVNGASLQINPIRAEDEGWYECGLTYIGEQSSANGSWIYLTVHSPPRILASSPKLLQFRRKDSVTIFCDGTGSPDPVLQWRKDGEVLYNTDRTRVTGTEVKITDLQRQDGGIYMCTFTNSVGEISQLIKLVVEGSPYIMTSPRNMTAVEGQRIKFSCGAEAYPDNITYYWYKDGVDVKTLPVYNKRLTLTPDGGLLLTGVVKEDMGWYKCIPNNGIGQDEASAFLNVTYYPRVLNTPTTVFWARGYNHKLDCPVDANPPMTHTIWAKGQSRLESQGRVDILVNGTLLVSQVEQGDAGIYSCTPVSALGQGEPSPNIQVSVRDPPYFIIRPNALYQRHPGESVVLPCSAGGTPAPSVSWKKVDGFIDMFSSRVSILGGNLSISSTVKEDHGNYECIASNSIATVLAMTELRILNTTPHAPYNVTVIPSSFTAEISWEPAYDGGKPQFYMLW